MVWGEWMDTQALKDAAAEISAICDLFNKESSKAVTDNKQLAELKKSLSYMKERIIKITFQVNRELKAIEKKEKL